MNHILKAQTIIRNPALVHKVKGIIRKGIKSDEEIKAYVIKRLNDDFQNEMSQIEEEQEKILREFTELKKNEQ